MNIKEILSSTKFLLDAYSKNDVSLINDYGMKSIANHTIDLERQHYKEKINKLFQDFSKYDNFEEIQEIIKKQSIPIKYFLFEKIMVVSSFCKHSPILDRHLDVKNYPEGVSRIFPELDEMIHKCCEKNKDGYNNIVVNILGIGL